MSFPRYPKYKESGVEWLGEVPEGWKVTALKRGFNVTLGKMLQPESSNSDDELLPYLRAANIQWGGVDITDIKQMWLSKRDRAQLRLESGDLLVSEGGDVGRSCLWTDEIDNCYFQNSVNRVRARDGHSNDYLYYWMSTIKDKGYIDVLCNKSTIAHFTAEKIAAVPVPFPSLEEQILISAFLDREAAKIDGLVAEQRRLIELLKEKRQAVISHAVTKGLNPNAKMKPSGVEWLGNVPEHWTVKKLAYLLSEAPKNGVSPEITAEGSTPTFSIAAVRNGCVDIKNHLKYASIDLQTAKPYFVKQHDILVLRGNGSKDLVGTAGIVVTMPPENCIYPDILIRIRPNNLVLPSYLVAWLNSSALRPQIQTAAQTGAGIWKISGSSLQALRLPMPSVEEQSDIERYLQSNSLVFDALTAEARRAIDLLQEHRTALISAAVTGKIDVRNAVKFNETAIA